MKRILALFAPLFFVTAAIAQPGGGPGPVPGVWTQNGTSIYNNNTGNVGVGTGAPTSKLEVKGCVNVDGATSGKVSVCPQTNSGTYNLNLPTTAGTAGQALFSAGGGSAASVWNSVATTVSQESLIASTNFTGIAALNLLGWNGPSTKGGGILVLDPNDTTSSNDGCKVFVDSAGNRFKRTSGALGPASCGGYEDALTSSLCSVSSSSTALTCTDVTFSAADVGKTLGCLFAGASNTGGWNSTWSTTIATFTSTHVVQGTTTATNAISNGFCVWGHNDIAAYNAAAVAAGETGQLVLTGSMIANDVVKVGGNSATWAHALTGVGHPTVYCLIPNNTANCSELQTPVDVLSGNLSLSNVNFNAMNTGLDCRAVLGGEDIQITNVGCAYSYRDCETFQTANNIYIQQVAEVSTRRFYCGLHSRYYHSNDNAGLNGFIDELGYYDVFDSGWGYNSSRIVGQAVTGAADNGSGFVRITVASNTARDFTNYTSGQPVTGIGIGGTTEANGVNPGTKISTTTLDLTYAVTGAVSGTSSRCRLTLSAPSTVGLTNGGTYTVGGIAGATGTACNGSHVISIVTFASPTVVEMVGTTFAGTYSSGGVIGVPFVHAFTSGGRIMPSTQAGADEYHISNGTGSGGNDNLQVRYSYNGPVELDDDRGGVQTAGSDSNPNGTFLADGTLPHVIEGAGVGGSLASAYQSYYYVQPTIENSAGVHSPGAVVARETSTVTPVGVQHHNEQLNGNYDQGGGPTMPWSTNGNVFESQNAFGGVAVTQQGSAPLGPLSTVAALPSCNSATAGMRAVVNDGSGVVYGSGLTGGGSTVVGAMCTGGGWVAD